MMNLFEEIEKSFSAMEKLLSEKALLEFTSCDYENLDMFHFGMGMWIRNDILSPQSTLYKLFVECGISQMDDMSSLMMQLFYVFLKSKTF